MSHEIHRGELPGSLESYPAESFDLVHADPPYFRVLAEAWDRQWSDREVYLGWLKTVLDGFQRVLKPNGSLYLWASAELVGYVEVQVVAPRFEVLSSIVWRKSDATSRRVRREELRSYLGETERCIFAGQHGADEDAAGEAGFVAAERALKKRIFGDYLDGEMTRAGVSPGEVAALFPSSSGGMTGCVSNWIQGYNIPTSAQWPAIRERLNRREHGHLRREYEDLRREYEDLRRPFSVTSRTTHADVWEYESAERVTGRHPAEKPLDMMRDIVRASTREGARVLDAFAGSGTMTAACVDLERDVVAIEKDPELCDDIERRAERHEAARTGRLHRVEMKPITGSLFA